jgi:hypothetical protein
MMKRLLACCAALVLVVACSFQTVDAARPVAVADAFYGALRSGDGRAAWNQFAAEFKAEEVNWPRLLEGLQAKYGPVTSTELQDSILAANDEGPCYSLTYNVKRGALASRESLFVCAKSDASDWRIRGHAFTRLDSGQSVSGGILASYTGVQ